MARTLDPVCLACTDGLPGAIARRWSRGLIGRGVRRGQWQSWQCRQRRSSDLNGEERMRLRGLRQVRQRRGMSIGQLAEAVGLRRETIAQLEHGREDPQPYMVRRLETALGVTAEELRTSPGAPALERVGTTSAT
jgi:DNA-binding XRE family transcriptional regulator